MANAYYSNTAIQTTLSGSISSGATSINVVATTGFPSSFPYTLALDYGSATEELVKVTSAAASTLTVERGFSGTSAQSHSLGAVVRHVWHAGDAADFRTHEAATSDVHGVTGALVGATQAQTLTNKTLTTPTINNATYASGGSFAGTYTGTPTFSGAIAFTGAPVFSGAAVLSGTPSISNGAALAGTFTGTPTFSGNVTHSGEIVLTNLLRGSRALAADSMYESRVTADSVARWFTQTDGKHWWGPGDAPVDTNLFRSAASTLRTDDALSVGGVLSAASASLDSITTAAVTHTSGITYRPTQTGTESFVFAASAQVDVNVVFPIAFGSAPKVVVAIASTTTFPAGSSALIVRAFNITATGMTIRMQDAGGTSRTLTIPADWVAVG